jgi:hypothetical protein
MTTPLIPLCNTREKLPSSSLLRSLLPKVDELDVIAQLNSASSIVGTDRPPFVGRRRVAQGGASLKIQGGASSLA